MNEISASAQLAVLLMARWAAKGVEPLSSGEFADFHRWMVEKGLSAQSVLDRTANMEGSPIPASRLEGLLFRAVGVFQSVTKWMSAGLWICYWLDPCYPHRFKSLKQRAPILLFGYGDSNAFTSRALAIVGSRNASDERLHKASEIGRACAKNSITVVSGGAKGVDSAAMSAGIGGGGTVVGVLADSLLRESGKTQYRLAIQERRLCLMSEVHPEARFDVGMAMARNRLAYACADAALVIECDPNKGGTWAGALEALRAGSHVYVLRGARAERQLVEKGAIPIDAEYALTPGNLVQGNRPGRDRGTTQSRVDQILRGLLEGCSNVDHLIVKLTASPSNLGADLWAAALEDGWCPDRPTKGVTTAKMPKGRNRKRATEPTLFVHEAESEYSAETGRLSHKTEPVDIQ